MKLVRGNMYIYTMYMAIGKLRIYLTILLPSYVGRAHATEFLF